MNNKELSEFKRNIDDYLKKFNIKKYDLDLYYKVIESKELTEKQLIDILCWKLAGKRRYEQLPKKTRRLIDRAIERLNDINDFKTGKISEKDFNKALNYISPYGPIIRIFTKHICRPDGYELFDQHVSRAFYYFEQG